MTETSTQTAETAVATPTATTIATLGPAVQLVIFRFLMKNGVVPSVIPFIPIVHDPKSVRPDKDRKGVMVLPPTPDTWLPVVNHLLGNASSTYDFVGARIAEKRVDGKSDVRFTFCHKAHRNDSELHPNFMDKYNELAIELLRIGKNNLWVTQAHLNPYVPPNCEKTDQSVLMFDSVGRKEAIHPDGNHVMVYEGGREKTTVPGQISRGIGPLVPLLKRANKIVLDPGNTIRLQRQRH